MMLSTNKKLSDSEEKKIELNINCQPVKILNIYLAKSEIEDFFLSDNLILTKDQEKEIHNRMQVLTDKAAVSILLEVVSALKNSPKKNEILDITFLRTILYSASNENVESCVHKSVCNIMLSLQKLGLLKEHSYTVLALFLNGQERSKPSILKSIIHNLDNIIHVIQYQCSNIFSDKEKTKQIDKLFQIVKNDMSYPITDLSTTFRNLLCINESFNIIDDTNIVNNNVVTNVLGLEDLGYAVTLASSYARLSKFNLFTQWNMSLLESDASNARAIADDLIKYNKKEIWKL